MSDAMMIDSDDSNYSNYSDSYRTGGGMKSRDEPDVEPETITRDEISSLSSSYTSMQCDGEEHGLWEESQQSAAATATATAAILTTPVGRSRCEPAEMEDALRIMTHAGRILWRAAMEAIPGGMKGVGTYNPSFRVLSKLFQKSCGKIGGTTKKYNNTTTANNKNNKNNNITRKALSAFSFGSTKSAMGDERHGFDAVDYYYDDNDGVETISDCGTSDDAHCPIEADEDDGDDDSSVSQPKKRKSFFGISSLLQRRSSVVSDSEEDDDHDRPSKRVRRSFAQY